MPVYEFAAEDGKVISVLVRLDEPDSARAQQTVDGKVYKRVYSAPLASHDSIPKDGSRKEFWAATTAKNIKVGDMWELSKEMSEKRAAKNGGVDPVKAQFYKDYEKRMGSKHADVLKQEAREKHRKSMAEFGIKV